MEYYRGNVMNAFYIYISFLDCFAYTFALKITL